MFLSWPCDFTACDQLSDPTSGNCYDCHKHLCPTHVKIPHHECLALSAEDRSALAYKVRLRQLNLLAVDIKSLNLEVIAQDLSGVKVQPLGIIDMASLPKGGMNVHVPIDLEDGRQWFARIRQQRFDLPPRYISRVVMESEIATMVALKRGGVLVPEVHKVKQDLESEQTLDFFLLDKIEGKASSAPFSSGLPIDQLPILITSYAKVSAQIANISFTGIGSLYPSVDGTSEVVGPLINLDLVKGAPPYFLGPFRTNKDRYLACVDWTIERISGSEGIRDGAEGKYYTHLWLRDLVEGIEELDKEEPTYIKHADDKGDHVMVDGENQVTGVIDWEWAYTAPLAEAFAAPLAVVDVEAFYNGDNRLSIHETQLAEAYDALGRSDLGDCVRGGKLYQRLGMVIGQEPDVVQLNALQELVTGTKGEAKDLDEWVRGLKVKYGDRGDV